MKNAKIILAGGGRSEDSRLLDETFASWVGLQGKLLYLPIALQGIRSFESCHNWITATFGPLGITHIEMWTALKEHESTELEEFDAIYIGGGNTYSLLEEVIRSDFEHPLKEYVQEGGTIYGGSAGAVLLGKDIRTVSQIDRNRIGLKRVKCLDLANHHAVWPHYQMGDDEQITKFVKEHRQPVLAISERSGVAIESGKMRSVGFEPSYRFDPQGKFQI